MSQDTLSEVLRINARLKEKILCRVTETGLHETAIEGLRLARRHALSEPEHCLDKPLCSIILQGGKRAIMGSVNMQYEENQCLLVGVDMPSSFQVTVASAERPFLAVSCNLNIHLISQLMTEMALVPEAENTSYIGMSVMDASPKLLDAFLRLVEVLDTPERIPVLAPMIEREIHYLLLSGPQGAQLRRINTLGTQSNQVAKAIFWMRGNFMNPVQIDTLAQRVNMATSTFHRHFKDVTTLSPLQYIKRLRLYEARRLMLVERQDANSASLSVGYESPAQFNREYKRFFGEPPLRDIKRLQ